jgi:hypothetical protein
VDVSGSDRPTARDARAIEALLLGASQREAAKKAGYSEATLRRRLKDPRFVGHLRRAENDLLARMRRVVVMAGLSAVDTLHEIGTNREGAAEASGASVRVQAAGRLLTAFVGQFPGRQELEVTGPDGPRPDVTPALDRLKTLASRRPPAPLSELRAVPRSENGSDT